MARVGILLGRKFIYAEYTLAANNLSESYNSSHPDTPAEALVINQTNDNL